jgi:hypothetical protein
MSNNKKAVTPEPENIERRVFEVRADTEPESRKIHGYAALFDSRTSLSPYVDEVIKPGAFGDAIKTSDVRALFNHDPNLILARTASGTLKIKQDARGLHYEFEVPNTNFGNDFLEMVRRGDISQSSFAFTVEDAEMTKETKDGADKWVRTIKRIKALYDVAPVTYPAYNDTTVAIRSMPKDEGEEDEFYKQRSEAIWTKRARLLESYQ